MNAVIQELVKVRSKYPKASEHKAMLRAVYGQVYSRIDAEDKPLFEVFRAECIEGERSV